MALDGGIPEEPKKVTCDRCKFLYNQLLVTEKFRDYGLKQSAGWQRQNLRTMALLYISALSTGNSLEPLPFGFVTVVFLGVVIWWWLGMRERDKHHKESMEQIRREIDAEEI